MTSSSSWNSCFLCCLTCNSMRVRRRKDGRPSCDTANGPDDYGQIKELPNRFHRTAKHSKSDTHNSEEFLIPFCQCRFRPMLVQRWKHPRTLIKKEQALRI